MAIPGAADITGPGDPDIRDIPAGHVVGCHPGRIDHRTPHLDERVEGIGDAGVMA